MQDDHNVVGYQRDKPFFATNTSIYDLNMTPCRYAFLILQEDGNLAVYTHSTIPVWSTSTRGTGRID